MSNTPETNHQSRHVIRLMLIEDDPVFRLGLMTALDQVPDLRIVFEADTVASALRVLQDWLRNRSGETGAGGAEIAPDVVIMSLDLGQSQTGQSNGLALCQQLKGAYPNLPLLLLSARQDPLQLANALQIGAEGYCPKGSDVAELVTAIRTLTAGQTYWAQAMQTITHALEQPTSASGEFISGATQTRKPSAQLIPVADLESRTPLSVLRRNMRLSGLQQINAAIALLDAQLQNPNLTLLDELVLTGRRRELRAARWLVGRLLAPPSTMSNQPRQARDIAATPSSPSSAPRSPSQTRKVQGTVSASPPLSSPTQTGSADTTPSTPSPAPLAPSKSANLRTLRGALFDATAAKLQSNLHNLTDKPLEIDILKEEKKRELLYTILRTLEEILDELRFSQVRPDQLVDKQTAILLDLWSATTTDFFGKYYTLQVGGYQVEIVDVLLQDAAIVQSEMLDRIPLVPEFFGHLLFQAPLTIDDASYNVGTVEAMARMEVLLQNLIIQVANGIMQPLINRFGNVETIKHNFYDKRLLSTREIERFRNNLSWYYRIDRFFKEPTAIFESRYNLLALNEGGIIKTSIYSPRNEELSQLNGVPLAVTLVLETRDAIAPRFRSAISFFGSGVVYLLTDVVGRGIGLIGRGIIKGIGTAFQDLKFSRNSERWR